ncbi:MAG: hypothetical protein U1D97_01905 [Desulfuromonadales bacterium]|nr:hypothetical protein [Desulfuromonadales bacterium]
MLRLVHLLLLLFTLCLLSACRLSSPSPPPQSAISGPTGISGQVTNKEGAPALGAAVYAYRSPKGGLRGPADFEALVGAEGDYFLDLVEGTYYLTARLRRSGSDAGPPRSGDGWAIFGHNPVTVRPGMTSRADLILRGVTQPMLLKEGSLTSGDSGFTGQIVDSAGHPVAGAIALAYRSPDYHRMPDYTAAATGEDGRFALYLPQGGTYCLAARTKTRGQPRDGEPYGLLAEGAEGCRSLTKGEIRDVGTIILSPYHR